MKNFILILILLSGTLQTFGQCASFDNHSKGEEHARRLFLYQDFMNSKEYKKAIPMWKELYECCKGSSNILFKDGLEIYKHLAKYATSEENKTTYNEQIATIYIDRIQCRKDAINKKTNTPLAGIRYYYLGIHYATQLDDNQRAFKAFDQSLAIDGLKSSYKLLKPFAQVTLIEFNEGRISKEKAVEIIQELINVAKHNLNHPEQGDNYLWMKKEIERLFLGKEFAKVIFNCNYFTEELYLEYLEHKEDGMYLIQTLKPKLNKYNCDENDSIYILIKTSYAEIIKETRVLPTNTIQKGNNCLKDGDTDCAIEYFKKGIEDNSIETSQRYKVAMRLGGLFQQQENWEEALKAYEKATEINPNTGDPYIKISMLYLRANKNCKGFTRQLVACISIDYFEKAATFEDTKQEAQEKIKEYQKYLPRREQIFQRGLKCGQQIMAGCTLKKMTKIRCRP